MRSTSDRTKTIVFFIINISLFLALAIGGIYLVNLISDNDFSFNLTPSLFGLAFVGQVGAITFSALAWSILLKKYQGGISFHDSVVQIGIIVTAKYIPGKLWGLFIRSALLHNQGFTKKSIVEASIIEQIAVVHSGFAIAFLFIVAEKSGWLIIPALVIVVGSVFSLKKVCCLAWTPVIGMLKRLKKHAATYPDKVDLDTRRYIKCFCAEIMSWLLLGVVALSLVLGYSNTIGPDKYIYIIAVVPVSVLIGFFALFAPGGLGVREGTMTMLLASLLGVQMAAIAALSFRVWISIVDILMGTYSMFILIRQKRKENFSCDLLE